MSIYAFTSITLNYLPKARILARSLKRHNPELKMNLLVAEPIPESMREAFPEFDEIQSLHDLGISPYSRWLFKHSVVETCTAQKGLYLETLLKRPDCDAVLFFDPDIAVFAPLTGVTSAFEGSSILLTPHLLDPDESHTAILDNELHMLKYGVYNLGFLGVKNSPEGRRFATWWRSRLESYCYDDTTAGMFTDQRWIDLAPGFFEGVHILRDRGLNVATWNIAHRRISGDFESGLKVNGNPLIFYHFSGFDSGAQKVMLDKYASDMPTAYMLRDWFIALSEQLDEDGYSKLPWVYGRYSNGEPILPRHRKEYRTHQVLEEDYPHPFEVGEEQTSFFHWCERNLPKTSLA